MTKDMEDVDRVIYRLWAVVVHLGSHNSGHFVTYRRIPSQPSSDNDGVEEPNSNQSSLHRNHHQGSRKKALSMEDVESKWWRISDEDVQIVDWYEVKNAEAYMLFFEKEETFAAAAAMSPSTV
jgi:ubiquitin C-terminal hydrolase